MDNGRRVLHTERRAAFDAKNRAGLPSRIPLNWADLVSAVKAGPHAETVRGQIRALMPRIKETDTAKKIEAWIVEAGVDGRKLLALLDYTLGKVGPEIDNVGSEVN